MTGARLFDIALDLLSLKDASGNTPCDVDDLRARSLSLINTVIAENSLLDCKISRSEHEIKSITSLGDEINMTDVVVQTVLPYALARLLILGEDDSLANEMARLYLASRDNALKFGKARPHPISEVYA